MPKPVQDGGVPLWISGTVNNAVARRIARFGSGWIPWGSAYADIPGAIAAMKDKIVEFGGDPSDLQVQGVARVIKADDGSIDYTASAAAVPTLVEAGVTDIRFPASLTADPDQALDKMSALVAAFRDATR
jgi:alkanesulfonate monooxygenase SsuD/methylene tetrahydromethanopterin reductase-like flavin-dependent oxidoreductase (luciferase family)